MPVRKVGRNVMLWRTDRIVCVATIQFPDGKKTVIEQAVIEPTLVHGANLRLSWVDECDMTGTAPDGTKLFLRLPREKVVLTGVGVRVAVAITATGYVTQPDGTKWNAEATFPDCRTTWQRPGLRLAESITAKGTLWRNER